MQTSTKEVAGVPIEIEEVPENTTEQQNTFYSRWHLLVNSNVRGTDGDVDKANRIANILKDSIKCVFNDHAQNVFFSKVPGDKFESPTIESVKIKMAAEIGEDPRGGRIHVHCIIDVVHHTILQINVPEMRRDLRECIQQRDPDLPFPFMRLKWIPVNQAIEKYIGKAPVGLQ